jgi:hypothetical protein
VSPSHHHRTETDQVPETLCFLVFEIPGRWTKSRTPVILSQDLLEPNNFTFCFELAWNLVSLREGVVGLEGVRVHIVRNGSVRELTRQIFVIYNLCQFSLRPPL